MRLEIHSNEAIFDEVGAADAVLRGDFVECIEQNHGAEFCAVHRDGSAGLESNFDLFGFVGAFSVKRPIATSLRSERCGIFEFTAFVAEVPDVAVAAVDIFLALLDGHVVLLRVGDSVFARVNVPLAPRCDDLNVRRDGFVSESNRT